MRDGEVTPYSQFTATVKPYVKGSICRWLSANYEASYGFSSLRADGETAGSHTFHQKFYATLIPDDRVQLTIGAEHFLTRFPEGNITNLVLLDASAVWRVSSKIRLSLTADNLLNRRSYEYVSYGALSQSEYCFSIRPLAILASIQYRF